MSNAPADTHAANELSLVIINDGTMYRQRIVPIINNLRKKIAKGTFNAELSLKLWQYAADDMARQLVKRGDYTSINVATRALAAKHLADNYNDDLNSSDWSA